MRIFSRQVCAEPFGAAQGKFRRRDTKAAKIKFESSPSSSCMLFKQGMIGEWAILQNL
jgi:hypothetical protein